MWIDANLTTSKQGLNVLPIQHTFNFRECILSTLFSLNSCKHRFWTVLLPLPVSNERTQDRNIFIYLT
jgi:hypothetical protein